MTHAKDIIDRCGGFKTVADWLGMDRSGVQRWTYPHPKGTGGQIPSQHWAPLICAARENKGIEIELDELIPAEAQQAALGFAHTGAAA